MTVPFVVSAVGRRAVMGVLNVTPDSFSDGGEYLGADAAIGHGRALVADGAAIVDVGGESTRPGAEPVSAADESARVVPVVRALSTDAQARISIDTTKAVVAAAALEVGASIVNDVSAATADPDMLRVVVDFDAGLVLMHMQGTPRTMQERPRYADVVTEVGGYLRERVDAAVAAGVRADAVLADPGIGFGKTPEHNLALLRALPDLADVVGVPLVVGTSRKTFLGTILGGAPVDERDDATLATTVWCFVHGAVMVRVHDAASSVRAALFLDMMERATPNGMVAA
ncbi:MAG: dihydropteroate synthase [Actinomycetota bacterium]